MVCTNVPTARWLAKWVEEHDEGHLKGVDGDVKGEQSVPFKPHPSFLFQNDSVQDNIWGAPSEVEDSNHEYLVNKALAMIHKA